MPGALVSTLPDGARFELSTDNQGTTQVQVQSSLPSTLAVAPLRGLFYVDPSFSGLQTGSQSNPFTTIAAAFAAAAALLLTNITINLASGANVVENVTFPSTGEVTLQGLLSPGNLSSCIITGNVAIPATTSARRWLRDVQVNGNLSGNTSAGVHRVTLERASVTGTTNLTVSGAGAVRLGALGGAISPNQGNSASNMGYTFFVGAVVVQGTIWGSCALFQSTVSMSGRCNFLSCDLLGDISTTNEAADNNTIALSNCSAANINWNLNSTLGGSVCGILAYDTNLDGCTFTFTGAAINVFSVDASTAQTLWAHGSTVTGAVLNGAGTMNRAQLTGQNGNLGPTPLAAKTPIKMVRCNAALALQTPGTAGNAVLNLVYTDAFGTVQTKAVTPALNIAGAAGSEVSGSLLVTQNGTANFQWSVTGIVTPGALQYNVSVSLEPAT